MKKILVVLVAITVLFSMSAPSAFAAKRVIPFWQHGSGMYTFISIVTGDGTAGNGMDNGAFASTGATVTVTLTATDTGGGYTVLPTSGTPATTAGATFAVATFTATKGQQMLIDTWQIGTSLTTNVWATTGGRYATSSSGFGYGTISTTGSSTGNDFAAWACVYNGAVGSQSGFTVTLANF